MSSEPRKRRSSSAGRSGGGKGKTVDVAFAGVDWAPDAIGLLHVGKTGGTYLKHVIRSNLAEGQNRIALMQHRHKLSDVGRNFGSKGRAAFIFREPEARFVSGFYSRQRQGRPQYQSIWQPAEAPVFAFFKSPDALIKGFVSDDPTEVSMAHYAMANVSHLKRDYRFHFGSLEDFDQRAHRIVACLEIKDLDANITWFLDRIGLEDAEMPEATPRHETRADLPGLSPEGSAIFRKIYAEEFELYERMQALAAKLMAE